MKTTSFRVAGFPLVALAMVLAYGACGGDKSSPAEGTGGDSNTGGAGTGGTGGGAPTGGTTSGGSGGTTTTGGSGGGSGACTHTVPPNEQITDFSIWDAGAWGDPTATLTGGSFTYTGTDTTAELAVSGEVLNVTAAIAADQYAGFGLWFGPCVDASGYTGVTFTMGGDNGATQIVFQVQTSRNYPIDTANDKGECDGTWGSPCASNEIVVEVGTTAETFTIPFADLAGGAPIAGVDATELLGIQWQFNCGADPCNVDMTLDDVAFY